MFVPPQLHLLKHLDRSLFNQTVSLLALKVPVQCASKYLKLFSNYALNCPKQQNLVPDPTSSDQSHSKLLLLHPKFLDASKLPTELIQEAFPDTPTESIFCPYELNLTYDYWTADEIFKSIFPPDTEIVTAIEIVGKVGHINLRDHLLPYKHLIGEVLLDKNPSLTTIINKTSPIETEFRTFNYEILVTRVPEVHTSTSLVTEIHQSQIHFQLDVAKVYWNSRLHTEHDRLIHQIPPCSIVADVMCGVGPFSLPLAKHRDCIVVANDLNPSCIQYLQTNIKANHLSNWVVPSQLDASEFIQRISFELLQQHHQVCMDTPWSALKKKKEQTRFKQLLNVLNTMPVLHFQHYIMNLPASALQFLGAFRGLYASYPQHQHTYLKAHLPWIHVYCFVSSYMDDVSQHDFHAEIENLLHCPVPTLQVHPVRTVAPKKIMCCITFQLPSEVAFSLETSCM